MKTKESLIKKKDIEVNDVKVTRINGENGESIKSLIHIPSQKIEPKKVENVINRKNEYDINNNEQSSTKIDLVISHDDNDPWVHISIYGVDKDNVSDYNSEDLKGFFI